MTELICTDGQKYLDTDGQKYLDTDRQKYLTDWLMSKGPIPSVTDRLDSRVLPKGRTKKVI